MEAMPVVEGVEHSHVDARGLRFHVAQAGGGEPLVLLHGWPQHWYLWRGVIPRLAARYRVICPDLRGHGWSDAPSNGYEKEELASDLLAVLDALGLKRGVRLAGHDWGGWTGFLACLREPQRFERFVSLAIPSPLKPPDPALLRLAPRFTYQAVVSAPLLGAALVRQGGFVRTTLRVARRGAWDPDELEAFVGRFRERARARASVQLYRTFLLREMPAIARGRYAGERLHVPTHMVIAEHDPVVRPQLARGAERHADELTVEIAPGRGHFLVDEDPGMVSERLLEHMA